MYTVIRLEAAAAPTPPTYVSMYIFINFKELHILVEQNMLYSEQLYLPVIINFFLIFIFKISSRIITPNSRFFAVRTSKEFLFFTVCPPFGAA